MAKTVVGVGDPKAVQKYSAFLAVDVGRTAYWQRKYTGIGVEAQTPVQILPHLESEAGDTISYDLVMQLKTPPIEGDEILRNKEEALTFYTDSVKINQMRHGVNTGGKMARKRTIHNMRRVARARLAEYFARVFDELHFMYAAGARGVNSDFVWGTTYAGFAGNALAVPDSNHLMFASTATQKSEITNAMNMNRALIERAATKAKTMGGGTEGIPQMEPIRIDGEPHYVMLMHEYQSYDLRASTSTGEWLDIQKAAAGAEGRNNPIFKGGMGMIGDVVLQAHKSVIRFSDYGAGANLPAARALFMGRQAMVCAFGSEGGEGLSRFAWHEEMEDRGNQVVIDASTIFGIKKTRFNSIDFGIIAIDTHSANPG